MFVVSFSWKKYLYILVVRFLFLQNAGKRKKERSEWKIMLYNDLYANEKKSIIIYTIEYIANLQN